MYQYQKRFQIFNNKLRWKNGYKKSKELINKSQEILNNYIKEIDNIKISSLPDNFNLNNSVEKIKNLLDIIKDESIEFEKFIELYKNVKYLIMQCKYFIDNSKTTIKQLIQDNDDDFVEISYVI